LPNSRFAWRNPRIAAQVHASLPPQRALLLHWTLWPAQFKSLSVISMGRYIRQPRKPRRNGRK
jgi:hypothetical protein